MQPRRCVQLTRPTDGQLPASKGSRDYSSITHNAPWPLIGTTQARTHQLIFPKTGLDIGGPPDTQSWGWSDIRVHCMATKGREDTGWEWQRYRIHLPDRHKWRPCLGWLIWERLGNRIHTAETCDCAIKLCHTEEVSHGEAVHLREAPRKTPPWPQLPSVSQRLGLTYPRRAWKTLEITESIGSASGGTIGVKK